MGLQKIRVISFCDKTMLFSLYVIAFFLPISKAVIEIFSILAIICYLVKKIVLREDISRTSINYAVFLYFIICFLSIFLSSNFKISSRNFLGKTTQSVVFFFVVAETLSTERRIKNFLYILFTSSLLLGVDGIYQYFTHKDFLRHRRHPGLPRIQATFYTSNDFGCYLYSLIPFILTCYLSKHKFKVYKFLFLGLFVLIFICLTLTVSRGAWFAFLSEMLFLSIWIRPLGILFLALGIFIITTHQFYHPMLKERLTNFFIFKDASFLGTDRRDIWDTAWRMCIYNPWLGLGLGTFMFNFRKFMIKDYTYGVPYAHNCYLQILCEIGIIGLASFLSILVLFFLNGIRIINRREKTFSWYILIASLASILGYCVQMTVDTIFYSLDLGMLFWLILGLGVAAMKNTELEVAVE